MNANDKRSRSMSLRAKVKKDSSSKYKGVSFCKKKKTRPWRAYIKLNRSLVQLGYFDTELEAAKAYDAKAVEHFGSSAVLNVSVKEKGAVDVTA